MGPTTVVHRVSSAVLGTRAPTGRGRWSQQWGYATLRGMSFWDIIWFIFVAFMFIAYLMVLFAILADLFRDQTTSGVIKAIWVVCLIFFPLITAIVYLIANSKTMAERQQSTARNAQDQEAYLKQAAGAASPAEQVAQARQLLDAGAISQEEYDALKAKALA
jgi:Short C-terminal domain/Phospholipase_D-nuclease N-terminal